MSDPKRWLEKDGGSWGDEREILKAGLAMDPPHGAQDRAWAALSVCIGSFAGSGGLGLLDPTAASSTAASSTAASAGAGGGTTAGASAAAAAPVAAGKVAGLLAGAGLAKGLAVAVTSAAVLTGGYTALKPAAPPAAVVATAPERAAERGIPRVPVVPAEPPEIPSPAAEPAAIAAPPRPPLDERPAGPLPRRPSGAAPSDTGSAVAGAERASSLREESRMLGEARDALRHGNAAGAQQKLEQMSGRFPEGILAQEREALAIEALHRASQRDAASARAAAFLRAYPTSPHATKIRGFIQ
jgi:hypothetical protein